MHSQASGNANTSKKFVIVGNKRKKYADKIMRHVWDTVQGCNWEKFC